MSLPQSKVDELVEKLVDSIFDGQTTDRVRATLQDAADDALHDAYGCGEADERKRVVAYLAGHSYGGDFADEIRHGLHDPPDPAHLERCQRLIDLQHPNRETT